MTQRTQAEPSVSQWFRKGQAMAQIHRKQRRTDFVLPSRNHPIFLKEGGAEKYEEFCDGYTEAWEGLIQKEELEKRKQQKQREEQQQEDAVELEMGVLGLHT